MLPFLVLIPYIYQNQSRFLPLVLSSLALTLVLYLPPGASILYATHIFDGLDDWPTHLHYLCNKGCTGWQGKVSDLELYQNLRKAGEPSPLLRIAETWLRSELVNGQKEKPSGPAAQAEADPTQLNYVSGGGFSAGRMAGYDFIGH